MKYTRRNCVFNLGYHIIFTPKYRKAYLHKFEHLISRSFLKSSIKGQFIIEENEINIGDQLLIKGVTTGEQKIELTEMLVNGTDSKKAAAGATCTFKLPFRIRLSDKLYKIIE